MKQGQSYKYILLGFIVAAFSVATAQQFKSEQDRIKYANKLFEEKKFIEAEPHYLQILSLNRTSAEYNFKYGTCLLFSDADKEKNLSYLRFASRQEGVDPRVFYYLGRAFHINYMFVDAIKTYEEFRKKADAKIQKDLQVEQYIEMCKNGRRLLSNISELVVLDKKEVKGDKFMYSYDLSGIGGKILITTEFQTKYDQKVGHRSVVHFPANHDNVIFYSSYGSDGTTGLDLYKINRLPDGSWSAPQRLPDNINTPYDDDFGFMHPNGTTFYFSSKGHNSMGGYDIFKAEYDPERNTFSRPVNLDFKINTPADDVLYVADSLNKEAFFASDRASKGGYFSVYNVRVEVIPVMNVILAGNFKNEIDKLNKQATIKVRDPAKDLLIGVFNSSSQNGDYLIVLPKGGKYEFTVETRSGSKTHTIQVDVPPQKEIRPLKQEMALVKENNEEKLVLRNLFDQEVENASDIIAQAMKIIANPDVNADQFPEVDEPVVDVKETASNVSDDQLIEMAEKWAEDAKEEAEKVTVKKELAYQVAADKMAEYESLIKEGQDKLNQAQNETDAEQKLHLLKEAEEALETAEIQKEQAKTAINLGEELEQTAIQKTLEAQRSEAYAQQIKSALQSDSHEEAVKQLREMQEFVTQVVDVDVNKKNAYDEAREKATTAQNEAAKALDKANAIRRDQDDLRRENTRLQNELKTTRKKDEKEKIQLKIDANSDLLKQLDAESETAFSKAEQLQKTATKSGKEADMLGDMYNRIEFTEAKPNALSGEQKSALKSRANKTDDEQLLAQTTTKIQEEKSKVEALLTKQDKPETKDTADKSREDSYRDIENQLAAAEKLSGEEKLKKQNEINRTWIQQIDEDLKSLDNKIAKEKDSDKKEELEIERESLMALRSERQQIIDANEPDTEKVAATGETTSEEWLKKEEKALADGDISEAYLSRTSYVESLENEKKQIEEKLAENAKGKEAKENTKRLEELEEELKTSREQQARLKRDLVEKIIEESETEEFTDKARIMYSSVKPADATAAKRQNEEIDQLDNQLANKELKLTDDFLKAGINPSSDSDVSAELGEIAALRENLKTRKQENQALITPVPPREESVVSGDSQSVDPITSDARLNQINQTWENSQNQSATNPEVLSERINQSETYLNALDEKITALTTAVRNTPDNESSQDIQNQIIKLQEKRSEVRAILEEDKKKQAVEKEPIADIPPVGKTAELQEVEKNYTASTIPEFESTWSATTTELKTQTAQSELAVQQKNIDQIKKLEGDIASLTDQLEQTSDPKNQQKIAKQIESKEKEKATKEIQVNPAFEKASTIEIESAQHAAKDKREAVEKLNLSKSEDISMAHKHEQLAQNKLEEARQLREDAKKERDPLAKSEKLRTALAAEQSAIKHIEEAEKIYSRLLDEFVVKLSTADDKLTTERVLSLATDFDNKSEELSEQADALRGTLAKTPKTELNKRVQQINNLEQSAKENSHLADELRAGAKDLEVKNALKTKSQTSITEEEAFMVRTLPEYDLIFSKQNEAERLDAELSRQQEELSKINKEIEKYDFLASQSKSAAVATVDKTEKNQWLSKSEQYAREKEELIKQSKQLESTMSSTKNSRNEAYKEVDELITRLDEEKQPLVAGVLVSKQDKKPIKAPPTTIATANILATNFIPPPVLTQEIFATTDRPVYNQANPIPLNPQGPKGLHYKVQVGAFRNRVADETFKEFAPVSAEQVGDGLIRYQVGYFTQFNTANDAKNQVRGIGYSDAFVVAFYEGKRISLAEARRLSENQPPVAVNTTIPETGLTLPDTPVRTTTEPVTTESPISTEENTSERTSYYTSTPNAAKAYQVEVIQGLFFTVQVGVYSKPVTSEQLFNISPLNSELTQNKLIRYTTGNFSSATDAGIRRDAIRQIGVADAFVVAYYNGKKITVAEANQLLQEDPSILALNPDGSLKTLKTTSPNPSSLSIPGSLYKFAVYLGEYEGNVPSEVANVFITNPELSVLSEKVTETKSRYMTNQLDTYTEAEQTLRRFRAKGVAVARIIAYKAGIEVSLEEALSGKEETRISTPPPTPSLSVPATPVEEITFKVFLGEYGENVPSNVSMAMIEMESEGIVSVKNSNGTTAYFAGNYSTEEVANNIRRKFVQAGIPRAMIRAYAGAKEITLDEARQIKNK